MTFMQWLEGEEGASYVDTWRKFSSRGGNIQFKGLWLGLTWMFEAHQGDDVGESVIKEEMVGD